MTTQAGIILATESPYKQKLINRLNLPVSFKAAKIDETQYENELPLDCVKRLSRQKAEKIAETNPVHWIIASDQIALLTETIPVEERELKTGLEPGFNYDSDPNFYISQKIIGKPHTKDNAIKQLQSFSGKTIKFITGVTLLNKSRNFNAYQQSEVEVSFKNLSFEEIDYYLAFDQPFNCAGSFKVESLGIALFDSVKSNDPTSLEGLPLITVCDLLQQAGINCLSK
jgi:septum formation protein